MHAWDMAVWAGLSGRCMHGATLLVGTKRWCMLSEADSGAVFESGKDGNMWGHWVNLMASILYCTSTA